MRRRSTVDRAEAALPPTEVARWTVATVLLLLAATAWTAAVLYLPSFLGTGTDTTSETVRVALASTVPVALLVGAVYAVGRMRLERLARDPGPLLILPFRDCTDEAGSGAESALGERLQAAFQRHLLATRLHGATAIPSPGRTTGFIHVIEKAAESSPGVVSLFMRLARWVAPASSYEVRCTVLDADTPPASGPTAREPRLLVELTRAPRASLTPKTFGADDWDTAVREAAEWTAAVVLPRSRICQKPPWTLWQGQAVPVELFSAYLRFQRHRDDRRLDEAMEAIHEAVQLDPTNLALRLEKGKLEEELGMPLDALATYSWIVGQAARRDRRLAYLWFGPPSAPASGSDPATPSAAPPRRSWHFHPRGVPGLDTWHPVVYVARYRYALLLGHGLELAGQWWPDAADGTGPGAERCRHAHPVSARSVALTDARRILRARLVDRHGELARRLREETVDDTSVGLVSTSVEEFLGDGADAGEHTATLRNDAAVFLTSLGVWEIEHLIAERPEIRFSPRTLRALRSVLPHRSLQLILPRAILLKALCLHEVHGGNAARVKRAAASMVFPLDEPVLEPDLRGLLDDGWPAKLDVLERWIDTIMEPGRLRLGSWHEHYNVACVLAILLKAEHRDAAVETRIAEAAVTELEKAVARGYSAAVSAESDWILNEDPDLTALRKRPEFEEFERMHLGLPDGRLLRGFGPVEWQRHATVDHLLLSFATHNSHVWADRVDRCTESDAPAGNWQAEERANWELVWKLARDHPDWRTRLAASRHIRRTLTCCGDRAEPMFPAGVPRARGPATGAARVASGRAELTSEIEARDPDAVQRAIEDAVAASRRRLELLHEVFDSPGALSAAGLTTLGRPLVDCIARDAGAAATTQRFRVHHSLWQALRELFGDVTPAPRRRRDPPGPDVAAARVQAFDECAVDVLPHRRTTPGYDVDPTSSARHRARSSAPAPGPIPGARSPGRFDGR